MQKKCIKTKITKQDNDFSIFPPLCMELIFPLAFRSSLSSLMSLGNEAGNKQGYEQKEGMAVPRTVPHG